MTNLGLLLMEREKLADAEPFLRRALEAREAKLGADNLRTLLRRVKLRVRPDFHLII